jgi:hypothetical protein
MAVQRERVRRLCRDARVRAEALVPAFADTSRRKPRYLRQSWRLRRLPTPEPGNRFRVGSLPQLLLGSLVQAASCQRHGPFRS